MTTPHPHSIAKYLKALIVCSFLGETCGTWGMCCHYNSVVQWHQKIYFYIKEASILAVHAFDLLCNQGNNSSLVVAIVETFETHFRSDFCLLEQQSIRDLVVVKYGRRVEGSVFALLRASTKISSRVSKYSSCSSSLLFGLFNRRLCSFCAGAFVQEEMLAFINSIQLSGPQFLCLVFDFTKSSSLMHGLMDFLFQPTAISIVTIISYAYIIRI